MFKNAQQVRRWGLCCVACSSEKATDGHFMCEDLRVLKHYEICEDNCKRSQLPHHDFLLLGTGEDADRKAKMLGIVRGVVLSVLNEAEHQP
jgi:hypothetical protein